MIRVFTDSIRLLLVHHDVVRRATGLLIIDSPFTVTALARQCQRDHRHTGKRRGLGIVP